jgi:hypothetical protein
MDLPFSYPVATIVEIDWFVGKTDEFMGGIS